MQRPVRLPTRAQTLVLGALSLAGVATCGDSTVFVRVNVSAIPARTVQVALKPFVGGVPYGQELFDVAAGETTLTVGFKLPAETRGAFRVDVEPRGEGGMPIRACDIAYTGSSSAEISDRLSTSVSVSLAVTLPASEIDKDLYAVWGRASDDVWVAGAAGKLGHWNGCYWRAVASNTTGALRGIYGFGGTSRDIWAVGGDSPSGPVTMIHSTDGSSFAPAGTAITGQLNAIWGASPTRLWAVGSDNTGNGMILRNTTGQATAWSLDPGLTGTGITTAFTDIDGLDASSVYAVGKGTDITCTGGCRGSIAVYNGTSWQRPTFPEGRGLDLSQIYLEPQPGSGVTIWLGGAGGVLLESTGMLSGGAIDMAVDILSSPYSLFQGLTGFSVLGKLYLTLARPNEPGAFRSYDVGATDSAPIPTTGDPITDQTTALWGISNSDIWIIGKNGARYHFDGTALKKYSAPL